MVSLLSGRLGWEINEGVVRVKSAEVGEGDLGGHEATYSMSPTWQLRKKPRN